MGDPISTANDAWCQVFDGGPYTSLKMLEYLKNKNEPALSYDQFVEDREVLRQVSREKIETDEMEGGLRILWASETGRCTSFAVKVIDILEQQHPGTFDFAIYDLKGHRIARCRNTGALIDSSSIHGAFELKEGEWKSFEDSEKRWKWISGKSKFEAKLGEVHSSSLLSRVIIGVESC